MNTDSEPLTLPCLAALTIPLSFGRNDGCIQTPVVAQGFCTGKKRLNGRRVTALQHGLKTGQFRNKRFRCAGEIFAVGH